MNLFSLQSCMWLAYRIRRLLPAVSHIWLSTEMQASNTSPNRCFPPLRTGTAPSLCLPPLLALLVL